MALSKRLKIIFNAKSTIISPSTTQSPEPNTVVDSTKVTSSSPASPTTPGSPSSVRSSHDNQHISRHRSSSFGYVLKVPVAPGYCF